MRWAKMPKFKDSYWGRWVQPRARKILFHGNIIVSVVLGLVCLGASMFTSPLAPKSRMAVSDISEIVMSFAAFGLSVAIPAVTLIIVFPRGNLLKGMTTPVQRGVDGNGPVGTAGSGKKPSATAFSDLVFLFSWTGVVQVLAAATAFVCSVFAGKAEMLTLEDPVGMIAGAVVISFGAYAILQMLTAIVTLADVADLQEQFWRQEHWDK